MQSTNEFVEEMLHYSIDDLELIRDTQKDLYSQNEMDYIENRIAFLKKKEEENEISHLPDTIKCHKCDGPNDKTNENCVFCGAKLDKFETSHGGEYSYDSSDDSNVFRYVISFLIPLVAFIMGAILLADRDYDRQHIGKTCIILGVISSILPAILMIILIMEML